MCSYLALNTNTLLTCNSALSWQYHMFLFFLKKKHRYVTVGIFSGSFFSQLDSTLCPVILSFGYLLLLLLIYRACFLAWIFVRAFAVPGNLGVYEIRILQVCNGDSNLPWHYWITAFPSFQPLWHVNKGNHFTVVGYQDTGSWNLI